MLQDVDTVIDRLGAVVDAAPRDLETVERTLTDGYAQALALEAERGRLEKRLREVAHGLARGDASATARELSELAARLDGNSEELFRLRAVLASLRRHADAIRRRG